MWSKSNDVKKMSDEINRNYSDIEKWIETFFPDYAKSNNSLTGRNKFLIEAMNRLLDCLRVQKVKRSESWLYQEKI